MGYVVYSMCLLCCQALLIHVGEYVRMCVHTYVLACIRIFYLFICTLYVYAKFMLYGNAFTGNLGRVDYITEFEYDLFIRPDTCNPRFRVWFNFTVENVKQDQVRTLYFI